MGKLKVGMIGLGGIARSHCDAIATLDNVEVVAVADLFEEKRREYMTKYNIPRGYATHTELLKDSEVDAVAVVLGHQLHHQLTIDACNAGKHVLVEKPMTVNSASPRSPFARRSSSETSVRATDRSPSGRPARLPSRSTAPEYRTRPVSSRTSSSTAGPKKFSWNVQPSTDSGSLTVISFRPICSSFRYTANVVR